MPINKVDTLKRSIVQTLNRSSNEEAQGYDQERS